MAKTECCGCTHEVSEKEMMSQLDKIISDYKERPGNLIPILQMAQALFGHLPEKVLKKISLELKKSYSEVAGAVSFYSFFSTKPRGKHVIRVCLGTACYVRGGLQVLEALKKELQVDVGDTTPDRLFTLEVARCFGACGLAPAMSIDDEVYKRVRAIKIPEIIKPFRKKVAVKKGASK